MRKMLCVVVVERFINVGGTEGRGREGEGRVAEAGHEGSVFVPRCNGVRWCASNTCHCLYRRGKPPISRPGGEGTCTRLTGRCFSVTVRGEGRGVAQVWSSFLPSFLPSFLM